MNIILVIFDSLRKDCVSCLGEPPWGKVHTPHIDAFAKESLVFTRAYPESLPTLPARRAIYTGRNVYPFVNGDFRLKGDFVGALGWGPIPEDQPTLAESLFANGYRTGLVSDVYHQFKPSKNYWRGFNQWMFLRGQENDPYRSGPEPSQEQIDHWLPKELQSEGRIRFVKQCLMNMHDRTVEEDYFVARVMAESARWLQQNADADKFFLTVESFDPHEPWFVPEHYRRMYSDADGQEQVISPYGDNTIPSKDQLWRTRANYSGLVTMCDRWFGHLYGTLQAMGLLENTVVVLTTDHGHSIGDREYMGKRGYPSTPEVCDIPLMIRHPKGKGAGKRTDMLVQHTDIGAQVLDFAGVQSDPPMDGKPFWNAAVDGGAPIRDHVTIGWSSAVTVIDKKWWLNCKVDGRGAFLYDLTADPKLTKNLAEQYPEEAKRLYRLAVEDAGGEFPACVMELCAKQVDAPGCSAIAARD